MTLDDVPDMILLDIVLLDNNASKAVKVRNGRWENILRNGIFLLYLIFFIHY